MPKLIKLYITHSIIGFAIAGAFVAMLLWFDVGNLGTLIGNSDVAVLATLVLWFLHGIVFASVQFAIAVMRMAEAPRDDHGPRGGRLVPVRVPAKTRRT